MHCRKREARAFKTMLSDPVFGGTRFDATPADPYPFCYAAQDRVTAIAETTFRDLVPDERGVRLLSMQAREELRMSALTLTADLDLVRLIDGQDLAAIGQDAWLVTARRPEYAMTRAWGHWLRGQAGWAHGFIWLSLRNPGSPAIVLFGDRLRADFGRDYELMVLDERPELAVDLDDPARHDWLAGLLAPYRVAVERPAAVGTPWWRPAL
ncbi:MAG: RES family NAD+ phosphorylase [Streptosporangiaceae bacterium]